jgi:hypothetical protein
MGTYSLALSSLVHASQIEIHIYRIRDCSIAVHDRSSSVISPIGVNTVHSRCPIGKNPLADRQWILY